MDPDDIGSYTYQLVFIDCGLNTSRLNDMKSTQREQSKPRPGVVSRCYDAIFVKALSSALESIQQPVNTRDRSRHDGHQDEYEMAALDRHVAEMLGRRRRR
jgi:hypothetical protein